MSAFTRQPLKCVFPPKKKLIAALSRDSDNVFFKTCVALALRSWKFEKNEE